jgi:CAAX prenyl protease-like protein
VVLVLWVSLDAGWMIVGSSPGYDPRVDGRIDWLLVAIRIAGAALVVPVMEELFWRSFLMRWIDAADFESVEPSQLSLKSFVITVLLFGIEHNLWLAGIVAGIAYGWLYKRYRNLWSPILAHAVTNGLLGLWVLRTGSWSYW